MDAVLKSYLEHICGANNVEMNVPLSKKTTWHVGGAAKFFVTPKTKNAFIQIINALNYIEFPYKIIGGGSNILAPDAGFNGVIIRPAFADIFENANFLYADAGAFLSAVAKRAAELCLSGLEFACGIPGTVGGAIHGNAGAHGANMAGVVTLVDTLQNGEIVTMDAAQCKFDYRTSVFKSARSKKSAHKIIILGAYFFLSPRPHAEIAAKMDEYSQKRHATQPGGFNAGSVFRNPPNQSAGALIDALGLKGMRIGGAEISQKHANFIINTGTATARDISRLIKFVQARVFAAYKIRLHPEIEKI